MRPPNPLRALALAALPLIAACPLCPDGDLRVVSGATTLGPGEAVVLELHYDGLVQGPTRCGGHWYVDGVEGGDATLGTIDDCGRYVAPAPPAAPPPGHPPRTVTIEAAEHPVGGCHDCCPWADRQLTLVP